MSQGVTSSQLLEYRSMQNLTNRELAEQIGVCKTTLHYYLTGQQPIPKRVEIILSLRQRVRKLEARLNQANKGSV